MQTAFFEIHNDLPREGPGLPEDVIWALSLCGSPARVLDAGCGPGADTETLAEALPDAHIDAVEMHAPFAQATVKRCARFGARVHAFAGDIFDQLGPYDLIWCAGAVYFVGVQEALIRWRDKLAAEGVVAFSHPVLEADASHAARAFWAEYPEITDTAAIRAEVAKAGYEIVATRMVFGTAWAAYYEPIPARIDSLLVDAPVEALHLACNEAQAEIDSWSAAPDEVAYLIVIARPK